jgi:hypothetical protein
MLYNFGQFVIEPVRQERFRSREERRQSANQQLNENLPFTHFLMNASIFFQSAGFISYNLIS